MLKKCSKCDCELSIENFSYKNMKKNIRSSNCKKCQKIVKDLHYKNNKEYYTLRNEKRRISKKEWWLNYKKGLKCINCGIDHPAVLDFHHRDPSEKEFTLSISYRSFGEKKVLKELSKCDVLCANCHRILHWNMDHSSNG